MSLLAKQKQTDLENLWLPKGKSGEEGYLGIDMYTLPYLKLITGGFPGGPVVKTPHFHCTGCARV